MLVGNKWYKCDLHIHSTASRCFRDKDVTAEQWVNECISKGLECVSLTDHNTGKNIDEYKQIASEKGLIFFPGVEVTCGDSGTHLMIIFDRTATTHDIDDFLTIIEIKRPDFASEKACSPKTVIEVINVATKLGAVVIPAHIDEYNGLSTIRHSMMEEVFDKNEISAVQVVHKEFYEHRRKELSSTEIGLVQPIISKRYGKNSIEVTLLKKWFNSVRNAEKNGLCITTFSDNPHEEGDSQHGLWGIGTRYTYIKMSESPSLQSLREALYFGRMRVTPDFEKSPNENKEIYLEELTVENTALNKKKIKVNFNGGLTTIIGGRGTGKSFITKFLVYVLGKESELKKFPEINSDFNNFAKLKNKESGVLLNNSKVSLKIKYLGENYLIEREPNRHEIFSVVGSQNVELIDLTRIKMIADKVNIYSQKQIYKTAKNQDSIRDMLDKYNEENIEKIKNEIKEIELNLIRTNSEISELMYKVKDKKIVELEKQDKENQIEKLSNTKYKKIIEKNREYTEIFNTVNSDLKRISSLPEDLSKDLLDDWLGDLTIVDTELAQLRENLKQKIFLYTNDIRESINNMNVEIKNYTVKLGETSWSASYTKNIEEYRELKDKLSEEEVMLLSNINILTEKLGDVDIKINQINIAEELLQQKKEYLSEIQIKLVDAYDKLYNTRKVFIDKIFKEMDSIKVKISKQRDFDEYINILREIIGKRETFEEEFSEIKESLIRNKYTYIDVFNDIENIKLGEESKYFKNKKLLTSLGSLRKEQMSELSIIVPSDTISVFLTVNGNNIDLSNASAGQKTSAILTMILAYGKNPLIMDQPEDDLDSQLINNLIVENLAVKKNDRQIVVITHNANIPVNGDAEWMICMGNSKDITIDKCGSVDDNEIKEQICNIMEGGKEAFKSRARRYGFKEVIYKK